MISILWTWGKSTKSVNQQDILNNVAFLQTMLEAWCRASVLSHADWWRVVPLMQVGKEVWARFSNQNKMSYREFQRKALLSAWVIIGDYGWCSLTIDGVDCRIEFSVDELLQDATEVFMWTVGYGTLRSWDKVYSDQGVVFRKPI
jgi:hypothetical protein